MATSDIVKGVSGIASVIPYVGPFVSAIGGVVGGVLEKNEAEEQKAQAARDRKAAMNLKPDALNKEFGSALNSAKMAEQSGLPGLELWKQNLEKKTANNLRSILESSPSGAAALTAISAAVGSENEALTNLGIADMGFRSERNKEVRDTLWQTGLQKRGLEDRRDVFKREGLKAAGALENAGTYNSINAINKIIGSLTSTTSALTSNASGEQKDPMWESYLNSLMTNNQTSTYSGFGDFTTYSSGATLPSESNMLAPLNYPIQLGQ